MPIVLDASVALSWCFADESSSESEAILDRLRSERAVVPQHWPVEVTNVLLVAERRNRLNPSQSAAFTQLLEALAIEIDLHTGARVSESWLSLGREYQLSAYDAAYLDLAIRRGMPLATRDQRLREAAANAGVPLI